MGSNKFKPLHFGLTVAVIIGVSLILLASSTKDKAIVFEIPLPERVVGDSFKNQSPTTVTTTTTTSSSSTQETTTSGFNCDQVQQTQTGKDFCGNVKVPAIFCAIKSQTQVLDETGKVIATEQSAFLTGNPLTTYSFIDDSTKTELEKGGFKVIPEMKCIVSKNDIFDTTHDESAFNPLSFPSVSTPIKVLSSDLVVKVFSRDSKGNLLETYNGIIKTQAKDVTSPTAFDLGSLKINSSDILKYVDAGSYQSWQHITVEGNVNLHWKDYPTVVYTIPIQVNQEFNANGDRTAVDGDVITYRLINVEKSGIITGKTPDSCNDNQLFINGVCVTQSGGNGGNDPIPIPTNAITNYLDKLNACSQVYGYTCFLNFEFLAVPFALFGTIIVIGAVTQKSQKTIYGVPQ